MFYLHIGGQAGRQTQGHTYLHTYIIHTYIPTYLHTYLHAYMPTCLHAYTPTHLHAQSIHAEHTRRAYTQSIHAEHTRRAYTQSIPLRHSTCGAAWSVWLYLLMWVWRSCACRLHAPTRGMALPLRVCSYFGEGGALPSGLRSGAYGIRGARLQAALCLGDGPRAERATRLGGCRFQRTSLFTQSGRTLDTQRSGD